MNSTIWPINRTLNVLTIIGRKSNEGLHQIPQRSRTEEVLHIPQRSRTEGVLHIPQRSQNVVSPSDAF